MRRTRCCVVTLLVALGGARGADLHAPAELRVTNTVQQPNPGAFTATIGSIPGDRQLLSGGAFEPLVFRTKFRPEGDSPGEIVLSPLSWHAYATFRTGFWDGAEVRVYRPRNGALVKVREDRVAEGGYVASGWLPVSEMRRKLVAPRETKPAAGDDLADLVLDPALEPVTFQKPIGTHYLPGVYHFSVRAVASDGRESPASNAASVELKRSAKRPAGGRNILADFKEPDSIPDGPAVPAPTKLEASIDGEGLVTLKWLGVKAKGLAGYRVYVCEEAPGKHRGYHFRLATEPRSDWEHIRRGDLVFVCHQLNNFSRTRHVRGMKWNTGGFSRSAHRLISKFSDEIPNADWARVKHPGPLPKELTDGGETCLRLDLRGEEPFSLGMYSYGGTKQTWYPVLQAKRTYIAEGWVRYRGEGAGRMRFRLRGHYDRKPAAEGGIEPADFAARDEWRHFRTTFSPGFLITEGGVGRIEFELTGPGTFWVDNLRVYAQKPGYLKPEPLVVQRTRDSALEAIRFHTHIKSGWSHTMAMLTNPPGVMGCRGHDRPNSPFTLPALLDFCRQAGTSPWFQLEMNMSEREWLGFAEWLAAPYDPATDSPKTKPWAHKRWLGGQRRPWVAEFDRIYFEISNETWNWLFSPWVLAQGGRDAATGRVYNRGEMFGLLNEHVLSVLKASPYWKGELEAKFRALIGGWAAESRPSGYGASAAQHSPSTRYITIGGYNGGWDEGEKPAEPTNAGIFRAMTFWPQNEERTLEHLKSRETLVDRGLAQPYELGTYEAGPGYAMSGLNKQKRMTPEQVEAQDQVGKSLANGVATLDAFLGRATLSFTIQNFFTMNFNRRYWTSHAPVYKGGQPYPSWMGLALYNNHGTGDFLITQTLSAPTADLKGYRRRRERKDAPLVGIYATRDRQRVNVFVLSRKLDGYPEPGDDGFTPVTLHLPFKAAKAVTLYKMTGDPRAHNLDEWVIKIARKEGVPFAAPFQMTRATTGEARDGLPPGSVFLYVFDGTDAPPANHRPTVSFAPQADVLQGRPVRFANTTKDRDGDQLTLAWGFAGKATPAEREPTFAFADPGLQTVTLTADDGRGGRVVKSRTVEVWLPVGKALWQFRDLWNSGPAGTASWSDDAKQLTIRASGEYRRNDFAFAFPPRQFTGDCSVQARIVSVKGEDARRRPQAGLLLKSGFGKWDRKGAVVLVSPEGEVVFDHGSRNRKDKPPTLAGYPPPCMLRLVRRGDTVTASASKEGRSWREVGSAAVPGAAYHAGAIAVSGSAGNRAEGVFGQLSAVETRISRRPR